MKLQTLALLFTALSMAGAAKEIQDSSNAAEDKKTKSTTLSIMNSLFASLEGIESEVAPIKTGLRRRRMDEVASDGEGGDGDGGDGDGGDGEGGDGEGGDGDGGDGEGGDGEGGDGDGGDGEGGDGEGGDGDGGDGEGGDGEGGDGEGGDGDGGDGEGGDGEGGDGDGGDGEGGDGEGGDGDGGDGEGGDGEGGDGDGGDGEGGDGEGGDGDGGDGEGGDGDGGDGEGGDGDGGDGDGGDGEGGDGDGGDGNGGDGSGGGGFQLCFSGHSTVKLEDSTIVRMSDLKIGDRVQVSEDGKFDTVHSFGHYQPESVSEYLSIQSTAKASPITISAPHMMFLNNNKAVPASLIKVGDVLLGGNTVTKVDTVSLKGAYAPFTNSGTIVVNGIVASNYVSLTGTASYLGMDMQSIAHTAVTIRRMACQLNLCSEESYNEKGVATWIPLRTASFLASHELSVGMTIAMGALAFASRRRQVKNVV